eukprot:GHVL01036682.1.p1 GENE.GHVL01036682.1~~GHVL01036682.1.p1  ORF type:complete len:457 (+),score=95.82 GHVL01036682.1:62-1432(+)
MKFIVSNDSGLLFGIYISIFLHILGITMTYTTFISSSYEIESYIQPIYIIIFFFIQMMGSLIFGRLSDSLGRKWVCTSTYLLTSIFLVISITTSDTISCSILLKCIAGLSSGGCVALSQTMITDISYNYKRIKYLGYLSGYITFSIVLGTYLILYPLRSYPISIITCFSAASCFFSFLISVICIQETLPYHKRRYIFHQSSYITSILNSASNVVTIGNNSDFGNISENKPIKNYIIENDWINADDLTGLEPNIPFHGTGMIFICILRFFISFSTYSLYTHYPMIIINKYDLNIQECGIYICIFGIFTGILQFIIYTPIVNRYSKNIIIFYSTSLLAISFLAILLSVCFTPLYIHFFIYLLTYCISSSFIEPILPLLTSKYANKNHQGMAQGILNSFHFGAWTLAIIIYNLFDQSISISIPFVISSAMATCAAVASTTLNHVDECTILTSSLTGSNI